MITEFVFALMLLFVFEGEESQLEMTFAYDTMYECEVEQYGVWVALMNGEFGDQILSYEITDCEELVNE